MCVGMVNIVNIFNSKTYEKIYKYNKGKGYGLQP